MGCTEEEFQDIKKSGCNTSAKMEIESLKNRIEIEKIKEDSCNELRAFLN